MRYRNFEIRIRRGAEGAYLAEVDSPAGEARVDFRLPFSSAELEAMLKSVDASLPTLDEGSTSHCDKALPPEPVIEEVWGLNNSNA